MSGLNIKGDRPVNYRGLIAWPIYLGAPIPTRFDGSQGGFFCGSEFLGDRIEILPLVWRWSESPRWGRGKQNWLDVLLINRRGRVGVLSLKKDSAVNLAIYLGNLQEEGILPYAAWVELMAEERSDPVFLRTIEATGAVSQEEFEVGTHWVLKAPRDGESEPSAVWASEQEVLDAQKFLESGIWSWNLMGEIHETADHN
jgi:hypothetical protein